MRTVKKAFAYITNGDRLLVFEHADFPEAGLQVPAGTIQEDESPETAVVREAREETGIETFCEVTFLGIAEFDARPFGKDELHRRHFFHLPVQGTFPERWRHHETDPSEGAGKPIAFDLYWLPLTEVAGRLIAAHDALIGELLPAKFPDVPRMQRAPHQR